MKKLHDFLFPKDALRDRRLRELVEKAKHLGLVDTAERNVSGFCLELIEHNEPGVAFDNLIQNMDEQDVMIDAEFYDSIVEIASMMEMEESEYAFMKDLVRPTH